MAAESISIVPVTFTYWRPVRNLAITIALTALAFVASGYAYQTRGFEMLIVGMGWAHVVLGFIFFFGRVVKGQAGARKAFAFLLVSTGVLWAMHFAIDITFAIYAYFLFHAFRDEIFIYFQTSQSPPSPRNVYSLRGCVPLLLLLLLITQPPDYRQDLRRAEISGSAMSQNGWTLFNFDPVAESQDHGFYFYVQSPDSRGKLGFLADVQASNATPTGELRVGDWRQGERDDLAFVPQYNNEPLVAPPAVQVSNRLELADDNKIGQTFKAERPNLTGIWLKTETSATALMSQDFVFRLASPPLLPLEPPFITIRMVLMWALILFFLWRVFPGFWENRMAWIYLALFGLGMVAFQQVFRPFAKLGYVMPMIFQVIVVFHYFSWYVFSYSKFGAIKKSGIQPKSSGILENFLINLRDPLFFTVVMIGLNLIAFAGVLWYYVGGAPDILKYGFNYSYFLYFLVFHVTFSFKPFTGLKS